MNSVENQKISPETLDGIFDFFSQVPGRRVNDSRTDGVQISLQRVQDVEHLRLTQTALHYVGVTDDLPVTVRIIAVIGEVSAGMPLLHQAMLREAKFPTQTQLNAHLPADLAIHKF